MVERLLDHVNAGNAAAWTRELRAQTLQRCMLVAELEEADAEFHFASFFRHGLGVPSNDVLAAELLARGVSRDEGRAQWTLGSLYLTGTGVPQDLNETTRLFQLAVTNGVALAHLGLYLCYTLGLGVAKDPARAAEHLKLGLAEPAQTHVVSYRAAAAGARSGPHVLASALWRGM